VRQSRPGCSSSFSLVAVLSSITDFENFSVFKPDARHKKSVNEMFDQVIAWGGALKTLREK
jgi:hypothetical protein